MGTNYYLREKPCPHCGRSGAELHIGKSSAGWNFGLRIYPKIADVQDYRLAPFKIEQIIELNDWRALFAQLMTFAIFDEYGNAVSPVEMLEIITERSHKNGLLSRCTAGPEHMGPYHDPNARETRVGAGTYDLCNYDFS